MEFIKKHFYNIQSYGRKSLDLTGSVKERSSSKSKEKIKKSFLDKLHYGFKNNKDMTNMSDQLIKVQERNDSEKGVKVDCSEKTVRIKETAFPKLQFSGKIFDPSFESDEQTLQITYGAISQYDSKRSLMDITTARITRNKSMRQKAIEHAHNFEKNRDQIYFSSKSN